MARRTFFSFHYKPDNWRAAKVRNIGVIDGNRPCTDNDWESVCGQGEGAIKRWIDGQMMGRSSTIVLIGAGTAGRKWINYEIAESWNRKKGLIGIHVHNLTDCDGLPCAKGRNPFMGFTLKDGRRLADLVPVYDPPYRESKDVYGYIADHIERWIDNALGIRQAA